MSSRMTRGYGVVLGVGFGVRPPAGQSAAITAADVESSVRRESMVSVPLMRSIHWNIAQ